MYEQLRNDFMCVASGLNDEAMEIALRALDLASRRYDVTKKELSLAVYNGGLPEMAKTYLVCKKIEGLSDETLSGYKTILEVFFRQVRKHPGDISTNEIRVFLYWYQEERKISARTLDKYREYITRFFSWANSEGYITANPAKKVQPIKYEKKERQSLTQVELEYLRLSCRSKRELAIVEFLYSTGCRVSELTVVKRSDVDWSAKSVHLFGKGKKHRTSYLNAKAEVSLREYLAERKDDCEYLFISERKPYRQLHREGIERIVRNVASRSEVKGGKKVVPHILRHTTATTALQNGMPIEDIRILLGHESIDTTMIYAHSSLESVRNEHKKHIL